MVENTKYIIWGTEKQLKYRSRRLQRSKRKWGAMKDNERKETKEEKRD